MRHDDTLTRRPGSVWLMMFAVLVLGAVSCDATQLRRPPVTVRSQHGLVHAHDLETAEELARSLDHLVPLVRSRIPGGRDAPVELWMVDRLKAELEGLFHRSESRIELPREERAGREAVLTHELVHHVLGDDWATLPLGVEEGLCHLIVSDLHPELAPTLRMQAAVGCSAVLDEWSLVVDYEKLASDDAYARIGPDDLERVELTHVLVGRRSAEARAISRRFAEQMSGVGQVIASRIVMAHGVGGLHHRCLDASARGEHVIQPQPLLEAAALPAPDDAAAWRRVIDDLWGSEELAAFAVTYEEQLCELLVSESAFFFPDLTSAEYFDRIRPAHPRFHSAMCRLSELVSRRCGRPPTAERLRDWVARR